MDRKSEVEVLRWIKSILNLKIDENTADLFSLIEDGVLLCKLINKLVPKKCKYVESSMVFKKMENVESFLRAAREIGVQESEVFQTSDLVFSERRNPKQVCICLYALSRNIKKEFPKLKYKVIGPALATKNVRNFSEEQLRKGEKIISLQMGTNKGATQAGIGIGKRQIAPGK